MKIAQMIPTKMTRLNLNITDSLEETVRGNGGFGAGQDFNGGAGGKGVVILSMPDANYSGTTTGSLTT